MITRIKPRRVYDEPEEKENLIPIHELEEFIRSLPPCGEFKPGLPFYNRDGDMIEIWLENESSYAESLGEITVERAQSDNRIVGIKIHRVKKLIGLREIKVTA